MAEENSQSTDYKPSRIRYSLRELLGNPELTPKLEKFIKALHTIQRLRDPDDPNSFWSVASLHGEPLRGPGATDSSWWGGYCNHGNILFPTWHRAYLMRLENALRTVEGCEDVTIPFWDECFFVGDRETDQNPLPSILTDKFVIIDGLQQPNPLFSYELQRALDEEVKGAETRYSKPAGYQTVRYPQSGLVGNERDRLFTDLHNGVHINAEKNTMLLNKNVSNWLKGDVDLGPPELDKHGNPITRRPDTYSVYSRYLTCLQAPNYTVFSNTTSQNQWIQDYAPKKSPKEVYASSTEVETEQEGKDPHYVVSLESPHNAIHLAIGGFYQWGNYEADQIKRANGDMGDNETASFDPIFFLHHAFIDYVFWTWQKKNNKTEEGSLKIIEGYPGTIVSEGLPGLPMGTILDMQTPLYPFRNSAGQYYTSDSVTDIRKQLDYDYHTGSLDRLVGNKFHSILEGVVGTPNTAKIQRTLRVHNINRADYSGSFIIRTYATRPNGDIHEIGREAVLSRWNISACANCQNKLKVEAITPLDSATLKMLRAEGTDEDVKYHVEVQTRDSDHPIVPKIVKNDPKAAELGVRSSRAIAVLSAAGGVGVRGQGPQIQIL